jgi:subtilisin family serine protease
MRYLFGLLILIILIFGLSLSSDLSFAQADATATPVGIVSMQGGNNIGQMQVLSLPDAINRTGIIAWHDGGTTGRGIKIAVLDQGFGGINRFEGDNALEVRFNPGSDKDAYDADTVIHGTDVLTVIHSIAPSAELFACRYYNYDEYRICIDWFIVSQVNIINHSAGVPVLPLDGENRWALEVDRVAREGVLWVNAAGNFAGGFVNDFFTDTNVNGYHEYRGTTGIVETLAIQPINQVFGRILLSWNGPNGANANTVDLDLEVINEASQVIASSSQVQAGNPSDEALEFVQVDMSQAFGVRIRNFDGSGQGVNFVLFIEFATVPSGRTAGSIIAPGDSLNSLTVGSLQGNLVAPYSSQGPLITGANKPDLVAPGELKLPDGRIFVGTSAAAPIVSGVAALVWEINPNLSREQLFELLRSGMTIDDSYIPGVDNTFGYGALYLQLPESLQSGNIPSRPIFLEPTAAAAAEPIQQARVNVTDDGLKLRGGPGTGFQIIENMPSGTIVTVIGGPEQGNGYTWWNVRSPSGNEGWSVEYADGLTTLIFLPLAPVSIPTPSIRCIVVAITTDAFVRVGAGHDYQDRGFVPEGQNAADSQTIGTDGYVWWRLTSGLWVRSDVVSEIGDCDQLPAVSGR